MGNCDSKGHVMNRCQSCYGGWTHNGGGGSCDCTAGLGKGCGGKSCASYKVNDPGAYDRQYSAWIVANPEPKKPEYAPQVPITVGDFVCTQCVQCQDFSNITANELNVDNTSQIMSCIGKMETKIAEDDAAKADAATKSAAAKADVAKATARKPSSGGSSSGSSSRSSGGSSSDADSQKNMIYAIVFLFIVIIAVVFLIMSMRGSSQQQQYMSQQQYGPQPQYQQPQYQQPQYGPQYPYQQQYA